jgi:hypothetical protein
MARIVVGSPNLTQPLGLSNEEKSYKASYGFYQYHGLSGRWMGYVELNLLQLGCGFVTSVLCHSILHQNRWIAKYLVVDFTC